MKKLSIFSLVVVSSLVITMQAIQDQKVEKNQSVRKRLAEVKENQLAREKLAFEVAAMLKDQEPILIEDKENPMNCLKDQDYPKNQEYKNR